MRAILLSLTGLLLMTASIGLSFAAGAASLRCDKAILREGAHMFEVSELCGEPVAQYSRLEHLHPDVVVYVDEWVYQFGLNKFQRLLRFENGRLRDISTLNKPRVPAATSRETGTVHRISW